MTQDTAPPSGRITSWWRTATATRTRRILLILFVALPVVRGLVRSAVEWERERAGAAAFLDELLRPGGAEPPAFEGRWVRFSRPPDWAFEETRGEESELAALRLPNDDGFLLVEAWSGAGPQTHISYALRTYQQDPGCERAWEFSDWFGLQGHGYRLDCPNEASMILFDVRGTPPVRLHQRWTSTSRDAVERASYLVQQTLERRP